MTPNENSASIPPPISQQPQWDESIVLEYEARVEPFTSLFVKDLMDPILDDARKRKERNNQKPPLLLDVGCGSGFASIRALEAGFLVTAVDESNAMVKRTWQRAQEKGLMGMMCWMPLVLA